MAKYKTYTQEQTFLIPFDVDINIPERSYTRFLNDFFDKHVSMGIFESKRKNDFCGKPAKHCIMMLKIIFYSFSLGIYSMRELSERYLMKHIEFIYLSGNQFVDHSTLSRFINLYKEEITEIFAKTVYIANNLGYIRKSLLAIDSCPISANASRKFTGNSKIFKKKKEIHKVMIKNLLKRTEKLKEEEDEKEREKNKKNIKRLRKSYENTLEKIENFLEEAEERVEQKREKQVNLTDKDSGLIKKGEKYIQGYNCHIGTDEGGIIIATEVTGNAADKTKLKKMVKESEKSLKKAKIEDKKIKGIEFLLDKGYRNNKELVGLIQEGYNINIPLKAYEQDVEEGKKITNENCKLYTKEEKKYLECPGKQEIEGRKAKRGEIYKFTARGSVCRKCKYTKQCYGLLKGRKIFEVSAEVYDNYNELEEIRKKQTTWEGRNKYNKRFWLGEYPFGVITEQMKFKKFLVKGINKVKTHWNMACTVFNLRRVWVLSQA